MESSDRILPLFSTTPANTQRISEPSQEFEAVQGKWKKVNKIIRPDERVQFISRLWAYLPMSRLKEEKQPNTATRQFSFQKGTKDSTYLSGEYIHQNVIVAKRRFSSLKVQLAEDLPTRFQNELERIRRARPDNV